MIRNQLVELLRERVYALALGYSAQDNADRLAHDPAMKLARAIAHFERSGLTRQVGLRYNQTLSDTPFVPENGPPLCNSTRRQPPDLLVQLRRDPLVRRALLGHGHLEHSGRSLRELLLPQRDLRQMNLVLRCQASNPW